jgi:hypothetical protein
MKFRNFYLEFDSITKNDKITYILGHEELRAIARQWLSLRDLSRITVKEAQHEIFQEYTCFISWNKELMELGYYISSIINKEDFEEWINENVVYEYLLELKDQYL